MVVVGGGCQPLLLASGLEGTLLTRMQTVAEGLGTGVGRAWGIQTHRMAWVGKTFRS